MSSIADWLGADVPVAPIQLDYSRKRENFLRLSGNEAADDAHMEGVHGLHPEFACPVQPLSRPISTDTV